ncbi:MAG: M81 family metallopeptidase [Candidatus Handelsmanbacteria bacterium]|nr:M81 family metallopeptidase [Candidatus Handelsmanbacteria bacterium]
MSQPPRIALGGILTECNELGGPPIDLDWFARYDLRRGEEILEMEGGAVGGMLSVLDQAGAEPVPLLYASTCPGGYLTASCYDQLKGELLQRLQEALPVEGVLLPLHGSAVAEQTGDLEGDLIAAVRQMVGPAVPIVATLDLHAHITPQMVRHADALVAWETYPHRDALGTGQRGARLLFDTVAGRCRPTMAMAKVPAVTSGVRGSTEWGDPFGRIMAATKALEGHSGILSTSAIMVHPYLDQPDMGSGALVVTDGDLAKARALALGLARQYWELRSELEPQVHTPAEAVAAGLKLEGGPVVLVETSDCCGGGAAGDSVATLKALLKVKLPGPALVPVVDPQGAAACHKAGVSAQVELELGHRLDPHWGTPVRVKGRVLRLSDGRFRYLGGIWGGTEGNMGPAAVLEVGQIQVLLATHPTYDWLDEQFTSLGMEPRTASFVVAKNPMNYRQTYGDFARGVFVLDTPGPTPPTVRQVQYKRMKRPYFPVDVEIPGLEPVVLSKED